MAATCRTCRHFNNDPAYMEAICPGLNTLSSGWASIRAQDGLCGSRDIYVRVQDGCGGHESRTA